MLDGWIRTPPQSRMGSIYHRVLTVHILLPSPLPTRPLKKHSPDVRASADFRFSAADFRVWRVEVWKRTLIGEPDSGKFPISPAYT